jgi:hypothetical protein
MGIFGVLKPAPYEDPVLGTVRRRGGQWHGEIAPGREGAVPLMLAGGLARPNDACLALARELVTRYEQLRPAIARALFEQYEPYGESTDVGEEAGPAGLPRLTRPDQVWEHVSLVRVLIEPLGGIDTVELAYRTAWDEEHTLGARFRRWELVELNGSVLE